MSNQVVQQVDLGLRVLGVDQCEYAVDGVRGKTLGQAVGLASIHRATALEYGISGYAAVIRLREKKIDELSAILAVLAATHAQWDENSQKGKEKVSYNSPSFMIDLAGRFDTTAQFVAALDKYGITHGDWDTSRNISAASMDKIQADANYKVQMESTDMQSDMTTLQSYMNKRDSAFSTASELQRKCDKSISAQMKYMGS